MSNLVTGTYRVTLDGVETVHTLSAMPYEQFWLRQDTVVDALKTCSKWGMEQIFGLPPRFTESATGDVSYEYQVDFSAGGNSHGGNSWHGIPADGARKIAEMLNAAFG